MIQDNIRKVRQLRDFSQEYMAKALKISQPAYSDLESNKTKLTLERLIEISKLLETDVIDLINFNENQAINNTFYNESKGFFNIKELIIENFNYERNHYKEIIKQLKDEINELKLRK